MSRNPQTQIIASKLSDSQRWSLESRAMSISLKKGLSSTHEWGVEGDSAIVALWQHIHYLEEELENARG